MVVMETMLAILHTLAMEATIITRFTVLTAAPEATLATVITAAPEATVATARADSVGASTRMEDMVCLKNVLPFHLVRSF